MYKVGSRYKEVLNQNDVVSFILASVSKIKLEDRIFCVKRVGVYILGREAIEVEYEDNRSVEYILLNSHVGKTSIPL